jgi:hypothetical protein
MCFRDDAERGLETRHLSAIADRIESGDLTPETAVTVLRPSKMHPDRVWFGTSTEPCAYLSGLSSAAAELPKGTGALRSLVEQIKTAAI